MVEFRGRRNSNREKSTVKRNRLVRVLLGESFSA